MYSINNPWFVHHITTTNNTSTEIKLRLFCFHHSGGTASFFKEWSKMLPPEVELIAIQLPGRETRNFQPFITDVNTITKEIACNFYEYQQTVPFIFFGHSLGSLIAFETIHRLQKYRFKTPDHLIVSGRNAPQIKYCGDFLHVLPDKLLIKALLQAG